MKNKKIIIAVIIVFVIALVAGFAVSVTRNSENDASVVNNATETKKQETEEKVKVTPTFMYFVSSADADYNQAMSVVESLKTSYGEQVKFDIVNVDENPDVKQNFPVDGQTPALIMLDTSNDICAFELKCSDEERLKVAIEKALK